MKDQTKIVVGGGIVVLALAAACGAFASRGTEGVDLQPITSVTEAPDGDCDEGDLYEKYPDPDCGGRWYGTPTPGAKPSAKKTPAPVKTTKRR